MCWLLAHQHSEVELLELLFLRVLYFLTTNDQ